MIICISANPAIDRRLHVKELKVGSVNRAHIANGSAGGKAAHVAMAVRALGAEVTWVAFLGGTTGKECADGIASLGIDVAAVTTKSATRVNLEIIEENHTITELLEPGGPIQEEEVKEMLFTCRKLFAANHGNAKVVLSGSLPPGVTANFYAEIILAAHEDNCQVLLDTSGDALTAALPAGPDLVKCNAEEAEHVLGRPVHDFDAATKAAERMIKGGAASAAVSLGAQGLAWLPAQNALALAAQPAPVNVRSTVGCGDATLGGFAVAMTRDFPAEQTIRLAVASGSANCLAQAPGRIDAKEVERLFPEIVVRCLNGNSVLESK